MNFKGIVFARHKGTSVFVLPPLRRKSSASSADKDECFNST
ncbi:hypothetical protein HMPREF7215_0466 [Pyramidobacter piscolens W5455]|uniref:Uncharacterized protein n=1 Tax=Pyramidobacter piscolens W5455 TaxID=352165 RepID=A0ABP2HWE7_9BACT|nr:hypothetical protein HMPREF7215_0466 [Pyramidobacter piscolens W5455]